MKNKTLNLELAQEKFNNEKLKEKIEKLQNDIIEIENKKDKEGIIKEKNELIEKLNNTIELLEKSEKKDSPIKLGSQNTYNTIRVWATKAFIKNQKLKNELNKVKEELKQIKQMK